jgi:hypothetical protein
VSAGGLQESEGRWVDSLFIDEDMDKGKLMHMWRFAVITYLRAALKAKVLASDLSPQKLRTRLKKQYERRWSIDIDHFASKKHFLRYAGRYVRQATYRAVSFRKDYGSRSPVREQGQDTEAAGEHFIYAGGVRSHAGGTRPRPLPTRDSLLRPTGAWFKSTDLGCCVCTVGTTEALSSMTIGVGIFAAKGLWKRSPH